MRLLFHPGAAIAKRLAPNKSRARDLLLGLPSKIPGYKAAAGTVARHKLARPGRQPGRGCLRGHIRSPGPNDDPDLRGLAALPPPANRCSGPVGAEVCHLRDTKPANRRALVISRWGASRTLGSAIGACSGRQAYLITAPQFGPALLLRF